MKDLWETVNKNLKSPKRRIVPRLQHSEADQQKMLFKWAKLQENVYPELFWLNGSANGQYITNVVSRTLANLLGRKKGHPDIQLPVPKGKYVGLYIEMKCGKNKTTLEQNIWLDGLSKLGHKTCVCYSFEEAKDIIIEYLKGNDK